MFGSKSLSCVSGNTNFTRDKNRIAHRVLVYFLIPYSVIYLFILISNLMLIYGFHKTSRPFTIVTKLFTYLSMIDIILGSTTLFYCVQSFLNIDLPCFVDLAVLAIMQFSNFLEIFIFGTISFLRYWSIRKPLHTVGIKSIFIVFAIETIVCALLASTTFLITKLTADPGNMVTLYCLIPVTNLIAILFIIFVNALSYKKLKSSKNDSVFSKNIGNIQRRKRNSKAIICLLIITAFYVICLLPMMIISIFIIIELFSQNSGVYLMMVAQLLYISNSGINSLVVICRTKKLRMFYRMNNNIQEGRIELN